jgi:hypothetical protein
VLRIKSSSNQLGSTAFNVVVLLFWRKGFAVASASLCGRLPGLYALVAAPPIF